MKNKKETHFLWLYEIATARVWGEKTTTILTNIYMYRKETIRNIATNLYVKYFYM